MFWLISGLTVLLVVKKSVSSSVILKEISPRLSLIKCEVHLRLKWENLKTKKKFNLVWQVELACWSNFSSEKALEGSNSNRFYNLSKTYTLNMKMKKNFNMARQVNLVSWSNFSSERALVGFEIFTATFKL